MHSDRHLHIITFNIPYPPDYGGLIDVYYKIKSLAEKGIKIHLHSFLYNGRKESEILNDLSFETHYYKRKLISNPFNDEIPLMVKTRRSEKLLENLLCDQYPILFEGLHCTYYLGREELVNRMKIIRMHNIENIYYKNLARVEKNPIKRYYLNSESNRLKNYQKIISRANYVAAISPADQHILNLKYQNSFYLPVFHQNTVISSHTGLGDYILYHGNLGIGENNEAALYLVNEVFYGLDIPCYIAGSNPSPELVRAVKKNQNVILKVNISNEEINDLIENAQINVIPTFQDTGIKLKLINALFRGRHCIVNTKMVKDTGLEDFCIIADDSRQMLNKIALYFDMEFENRDIDKRKSTLLEQFDNSKNADMLISKIFN
jgi:hypothetical protein